MAATDRFVTFARFLKNGGSGSFPKTGLIVAKTTDGINFGIKDSVNSPTNPVLTAPATYPLVTIYSAFRNPLSNKLWTAWENAAGTPTAGNTTNVTPAVKPFDMEPMAEQWGATIIGLPDVGNSGGAGPGCFQVVAFSDDLPGLVYTAPGITPGNSRQELDIIFYDGVSWSSPVMIQAETAGVHSIFSAQVDKLDRVHIFFIVQTNGFASTSLCHCFVDRASRAVSGITVLATGSITSLASGNNGPAKYSPHQDVILCPVLYLGRSASDFLPKTLSVIVVTAASSTAPVVTLEGVAAPAFSGIIPLQTWNWPGVFFSGSSFYATCLQADNQVIPNTQAYAIFTRLASGGSWTSTTPLLAAASVGSRDLGNGSPCPNPSPGVYGLDSFVASKSNGTVELDSGGTVTKPIINYITAPALGPATEDPTTIDPDSANYFASSGGVTPFLWNTDQGPWVPNPHIPPIPPPLQTGGIAGRGVRTGQIRPRKKPPELPPPVVPCPEPLDCCAFFAEQGLRRWWW